MSQRTKRIGRAVILIVSIVVVGAVAWWALIARANTLGDVVGIVLAILAVIIAARFASRLAGSVFPSYNVAEVAVDGPISRDGRGLLPSTPGGTSADDVVEQIERAGAARGAEALLLKLNTPGGQVVPSDDIRRAAEEFDGPTIAYATDICASGGYWIATGCDEFWARDASVVGSIGVIGSQVNAADLADRLGLSYERFAAGQFKDAGFPLKEMSDDDRTYLQGIVDGFYDQFVSRVAENRDLSEKAIRETEARVYLGEEARSVGLVDEVGTHESVVDRLEERLGEAVRIREFEPEKRLVERIRLGTQGVAYAFGAGVAGAVIGDREPSFQLR